MEFFLSPILDCHALLRGKKTSWDARALFKNSKHASMLWKTLIVKIAIKANGTSRPPLNNSGDRNPSIKRRNNSDVYRYFHQSYFVRGPGPESFLTDEFLYKLFGIQSARVKPGIGI
ncbi:hypothetical protein CEXT_194891 [Caerostris extrusa]|uniref:Uncharacterized protein n=1 Tax=Caerostris extrusa TaxID=172846 RepID=A0AAV4M9C7_CAEEX|nr:hypothetical protein CEXT_194891 [Caerostris extrusa]